MQHCNKELKNPQAFEHTINKQEQAQTKPSTPLTIYELTMNLLEMSHMRKCNKELENLLGF